jgi:ABC-type tungstate transport system substrate-binding protein
VPHRWQQAKRLPVTQHPRRQTETAGSLSNPHGQILQLLVKNTALDVRSAAAVAYGRAVARDWGRACRELRRNLNAR